MSIVAPSAALIFVWKMNSWDWRLPTSNGTRAGGPDEVPNGLALCSIHHKALDRGALGLAPTAKGYKVLISDKVHGESDATRWFWDCQAMPLRHPRSSTFAPKPEFVQWHTREVFRDTPQGLQNQPTHGVR